jgi:hypothetical protein
MPNNFKDSRFKLSFSATTFFSTGKKVIDPRFKFCVVPTQDYRVFMVRSNSIEFRRTGMKVFVNGRLRSLADSLHWDLAIGSIAHVSWLQSTAT